LPEELQKVDKTLRSIGLGSLADQGLKVLNDGTLTVGLDSKISDELRKEGYVRDLVRGIQNLRKETSLNVTDRIKLYVSGDDELEGAFQMFRDFIACETLSVSLEFKNSLLFDSVEAPHYNYVGDSILGYHAHMGAGSITSNIKSDRKNIVIRTDDGAIETGLRKIGAILGDYVEIGCGTVLNPGSIVGKNTMIYPLTSVRGPVPANSIVKSAEEVVIKRT